MNYGEIFLIEREAVQRRGRWAGKRGTSPLRCQRRSSMQEMPAGIIADVVEIGGRIHAAPQPYDQSFASGGR